MRSRLIWIGLLALLGVCVFGWLATMERKSVATPWESPDKVREPHLLARRLLGNAGLPVLSLRTPGLGLEAAAANDVMLMPRRLGPMEPEQRRRLLEWVERGGILVTTLMQGRGGKEWMDDSLLAGIREVRDTSTPPEEDDAPSPSDDSAARAVESAVLDSVSDSGSVASEASVGLPGLGYRLSVEEYGFPRLSVDSGKVVPEWLDSSSGLAVLRHGRGRIVVCGGLDWITNEMLPEHDHAQLLVGLCRWGGSTRRVLLIDSIDVPPWYLWLWEHAWSLVAGLSLLLLLWLWNGLFRREPVLPPSEPDRRSLREHVEAAGQWWWSCEDGPETLLRRVREDAMERFLLRHPSLSLLPLSERIPQLARLLEAEPERLRLAFSEPVGREPAAFTRTLRLLQELEERR